jgi:hypothetical protein
LLPVEYLSAASKNPLSGKKSIEVSGGNEVCLLYGCQSPSSPPSSTVLTVLSEGM